VELLLIDGKPVVENCELTTTDEQEITRDLARASKLLASKTEKLKG
jgi:hypothetical protein